MKKKLLLSKLIIFVLSTRLIAQISVTDTMKIYQEIVGDYEFYSDLQYYYSIRLYIEEGVLLFNGQDGSKVKKIIPVDLENLKFLISDSEQEQFLYFQKNLDNKINTCRLTTDRNESIGNKIDKNSDTIQIANKLYSVEVLRNDLTQIKNILINNHPAVYQFTSKELFEKNFNEQIAKINRSMNLREYYSIAASVVESVHCGHTFISLPDKFWTDENLNSFPFELIFLDKKAYVRSFYKGEYIIPFGSEIKSINEIPMTEIIESTIELISSDGKNETFKLKMLGYQLSDFFTILYGPFDNYKVNYLAPGSKEIKTQSLKPIRRMSFWETLNTNPQKTSSGNPNLDFIFDENKDVAVITIKSFIYYQNKEKFYSFIDSTFKQIYHSKIQNVILDLRDNIGGDPFCTSYLLSYLLLKPVSYFAKVYEGGYEHFADPIPLATKNAFNGNLYVLINGGCFSSTGHLCSILKYHKRCTFIGEETGGTFECNDATATYNTKETRMNLNVARMTFTAAVKAIPRGNGIIPDYYIVPNIKDIIEGKDKVKEFTYGLIEKDK